MIMSVVVSIANTVRDVVAALQSVGACQSHIAPTPALQPTSGCAKICSQRGNEKVRTPVEQLLFDSKSGQPVPPSEWVYTGSVFVEPISPRATGYLADIDGVLIGFVHSPAPVIENIGGAGVNRYGSIVMNPNLGLEPDTPVTLTVKALTSAPKPH